MFLKEVDLIFVGEKVINKKYFGNGLGIVINKGNKDFVDELNKGLVIIKVNGEYKKIYDKWMINK